MNITTLALGAVVTVRRRNQYGAEVGYELGSVVAVHRHSVEVRLDSNGWHGQPYIARPRDVCAVAPCLYTLHKAADRARRAMAVGV